MSSNADATAVLHKIVKELHDMNRNLNHITRYLKMLTQRETLEVGEVSWTGYSHGGSE